MKKVLNKNNQVVILQNSEKKEKDHKAILEYSHEDIGFCRLVFKYGAQVFVYQEGLFLYASEDEEPSHDLNHHKVIIDMEKPISPLQKAAYTDAKECKILLWQAQGKEEPQEKIIPDHTPLYSDNLTIEEYNKKTSSQDCWKPKEFEEWQVKQKQSPFMPIHKDFNLMDVVYWRNDYGVEFTSRIVAFAENGLHLAPLDVGGECYWSVKNIDRYNIRKATLKDIFKTSKQYEFERINGASIGLFEIMITEHPRKLETVFNTGLNILMRGGDRFLSYCEGEIIDHDVAWYSANTFTKACIQFEKEFN